jgi:SepF-like predicted cell division protein (DUF552 family)
MNNQESSTNKPSSLQLGQYVRAAVESLQQSGEYENMLNEAKKAGEEISHYERTLIEYALIYGESDIKEVSEGVITNPVVIDELKTKVTNKTTK